MTDKEAILSIVGSQLSYCETLYPIKNELKCINLCNSCFYKQIDIGKKGSLGYPCYVHNITDKLIELIPQLDLNKLKRGKRK